MDFGTSYKTGQPVSEELMQRFPITFILALGSVLLGTLLAIPLGILSAVKQYTWIDSLILVISMLAVSIPSFWLALMFLSLFSVELGWLPSIYDASLASWIMPVIVIALSAMSGLTRITRSSMLEVIRSDYIRTAQAKGQTEEKIITRHALRNAMIPILAAVGNSLGTQLGGALVIETILVCRVLESILQMPLAREISRQYRRRHFAGLCVYLCQSGCRSQLYIC